MKKKIYFLTLILIIIGNFVFLYQTYFYQEEQAIKPVSLSYYEKQKKRTLEVNKDKILPKKINITALGDSLTSGDGEPESSYPALLQKYLGDSYNVINDGIAGQTSSQILVREGGKAVTTQIITHKQHNENVIRVIFQKHYEAINMSSVFSLRGTLQDTYGTLLRDSTFIPSNKRVIQATKGTQFTVDTGNLYKDVVVIWVGRNDFYADSLVTKNIEAIVKSLPEPKKFLILSVINGEQENRLSYEYDKIRKINTSLALTYKDNYIDVRKILVNHYSLKSVQDILDYIQDIPPNSLRIDGIHLNKEGNNLVAQAVANKIIALKW